jgi:hypothetical protein
MPLTALLKSTKSSVQGSEHQVLDLVKKGVAFSIQQALLIGESDRIGRTPSPPEATATILRHMRNLKLTELEILTTFGSSKKVMKILDELGFSAKIVKKPQDGYKSEYLVVSDPSDMLSTHFWESNI